MSSDIIKLQLRIEIETRELSHFGFLKDFHNSIELMEAAKEEGNLLSKIRPPKLEDAGLEDCALPPESIKEAFFIAANSLRSWTINDDVESETEDVKNPPGPYGNEKGLSPEVIGNEVGVHVEEDEEGFDKLIGLDVSVEGGKRDCVDALQGLKIHEKEEDVDEKKKKEGDQKPILVEDIV